MAKSVAIVGAGIAGLAAAHFLKRKGWDVTVFEASQRIGGAIHSEKIDGFTLEWGPNTVLLNTRGIKELILSAGLWDHMIFSNPDSAKSRYIADGVLKQIPTSPTQFLTTSLLSLKSKLGLLKEPFLNSYESTDNPSVEVFAKKRFGKEFYENILQPFVTGIYAGDASAISVKYGLKLLWRAEQESGSVFRGLMKQGKKVKAENKIFTKAIPKNKMFTFNGGLATLCQSLAEEIDVKLGEKPSKTLLDTFDKVIYTGKPSGITEYFDNAFLKTQLNNIPMSSVSVLHLGFNSKDLPELPNGFGALTKENSKDHFLGILFSSKIFPHVSAAEQELLTVIIGGQRNPDYVNWSKEEAIEYILADLKKYTKVQGDPIFTNYIVQKDAIPQYHLNHQDLLDEIEKFEQSNPKYHIMSNFVRGISVGDCVQKVYELTLNW